MRNQRWPGDYQTKEQEFRSARREEDIGLAGQNRSRAHDYLAGPERILDPYQLGEMEPSTTMQLDTVGMQPHAREYLERQVNCMRSERKYEMISDGQVIDHMPGIQFSGRP
jgi:hypothetical protein